MSSSSPSSSIPLSTTLDPLHPPSTQQPLTTSSLQRFSNLLLEHGETHLECWAVVASSSSSSSPSSSSLHQEPSLTMKSIPGRLRLCTRSVVFEPEDLSRGIIRCPFIRMEQPPYSETTSVFDDNIWEREQQKLPDNKGVPSTSDGSGGGDIVIVESHRHLVMKRNNIIAPFESVEVMGVFRFMFLHSAPGRFLEMARTVYSSSTTSHRSSLTIPNQQQHSQQPPPSFDPSHFLSLHETPQTPSLPCRHVLPLLSTPGCCVLTHERLYFQPVLISHSGSTGGGSHTKISATLHWNLGDIVGVANRYDGLYDRALELYPPRVSGRRPVLIAFTNRADRDRLLSLLPVGIPRHTSRQFLRILAEGWFRKEISNFSYLMGLNSAAGRSFNDLSRYPVVPWVIADYESRKLDWSDGTMFRDLSKPVGALEETRLEYFRERMAGMMMGEEDHNDDKKDNGNDHHQRAFLYGTHYSAPGYVLYYLVRTMPEHMLCLQNGKFDAPDRLFHEIAATYRSALTNHADVKELIPEFYDPKNGGDFLINARGLQLGTTQLNERVHDVKLPPWARSPRDFLKKNRKALESEYITEMLPCWIDLIFGCKSRGKAAREASNLFHGMAYVREGDLRGMTDQERIQAELQATEFGIVPDQLFVETHPRRNDENVDWGTIIADYGGDSEKQGVLSKIKDMVERSSNGSGWDLVDDFKNIDVTKELAAADESDDNTPMQHETVAFCPSSTINDLNTFKKTQLDLDSGNNNHNNNSNPNPNMNVNTSFPTSHGDYDSQRKTTKSSKTSKGKASWLSSSSSSSKRAAALSSLLTNENSTPTPTARYNLSSSSPPTPLTSISTPHPTYPRSELKIITSQSLHGDTISACHLHITPISSHLTSIGLDGALKVHTLPSLLHPPPPPPPARRSFSNTTAATLSRLSHLASLSSSSSTTTHPPSSLLLHRSHTSRDPLASLTIISLPTHPSPSLIAFAGGHDDVIFAYGLTSASTLASVYSHRDAVTGLVALHRNRFLSHQFVPRDDIDVRILVSGSWDATVKVWSVGVGVEGETVSVNREALVELYDAESSIVSVDAVEWGFVGNKMEGVVIVAGCADGSFVVWWCADGECIHFTTNISLQLRQPGHVLCFYIRLPL